MENEKKVAKDYWFIEDRLYSCDCVSDEPIKTDPCFKVIHCKELLVSELEQLREFKKQAIKVVKFYGDRENWKFISYASDAKDVIRFDDVGCKSYCEDADFAIGSGGRRSREFLSKWGEK